MMGLLTTLSLVGSLVLWAGYQAFYVPSSDTDPLPDQTSVNDPFGGQIIPRKAFGRARFLPQTESSVLPQANIISRTGVSHLSGKSKMESTTDFFTSSNQNPYSDMPLAELLTAKDAETKDYFVGRMLKDYESQSRIITQTGEVMNPEHKPYNAIPTTEQSSMVNHSVALSDNTTNEIINRTTKGEDYIHNTTELDQLITTEDSHTLSYDNNVSDHNTIDKQQLQNISRLVTDMPVRNDSLHTAKRLNESVNSLNILYTLVTFVKNLESQERGNFSKAFDNLLHSNESNMNISRGAATPTTKDIAKNLLNFSHETESSVSEGITETQEIIHNELGITPAERIASEDAKVLSKEYMDHFGWQGYLLIFFIIVIVLLLITTLILFVSSYFTWRNRRRQTKTTKSSNSQKEA